MTNLSKIIDEKTYRSFRGGDWPSFADFLAGVRPAKVSHEIEEFVDMMTQNYVAVAEQDIDQQAESNQQRQQQIFFDKHVPSGIRCRVPWETMGVNTNGSVFICESPSWVPKFVGSLLEVDDVYEVLNSDMAQSIRQEIDQGRYYYCNHKISRFLATKHRDINIAPVTNEDLQPLPYIPSSRTQVTAIPRNLIFDFDYTCNFRCPSCRTELINNNKHHVIRPINDRISEKIKHLVIDQIEGQPIEIRWAGGEPFISEVYVDLMEYCVASGKNIKHIIQTNGSYLIAKADLLEQLLPHIKELRISFDAATAGTYGRIRVGGVWEHLLENVRHVQEQIARLATKTVVSVDFVVQQDNYREIPMLRKLCRDMGIEKIQYQRMWNWGTWPLPEFNKRNIYNPEHPDYQQLLIAFNLAGYQP
jgi:sulfatase maturation enzyme AslB (radical SAM superfamily)